MKARIICFTGMDGTGKTTGAKWLYRELADNGTKVRYLALLAGNSVLRKTLSKITQWVRNRTHKKDSYAPSAGGILRLWWLFCLIDAYITYAVLRVASLGRLYIVDRYFYDEIAIMACIGVISIKRAMRIVRLMPRPDILFLFQASAETGYERKPEHPFYFFVKQKDFYRQMEAVLKPIVINTDVLKHDDVTRLLKKEMEERTILTRNCPRP